MKTKIIEKSLKTLSERRFEAESYAEENKILALKDEKFKSFYLGANFGKYEIANLCL